MHLLFQVNWLAVAVTAIVTFALGALWYGPLFGKAWLSAVGLKKEELGSSSKAMILTFILNIVTTMVIALAIEGFDIIHWPNGLILGFGLGLGLYGANLASDFLFQNQSVKLLAIQVGYRVVCSTIMGTILSLWR